MKRFQVFDTVLKRWFWRNLSDFSESDGGGLPEGWSQLNSPADVDMQGGTLTGGERISAEVFSVSLEIAEGSVFDGKGGKVTNLGEGTEPSDAATVSQLPVMGGSLPEGWTQEGDPADVNTNGGKIIGLPDPIDPGDAVNFDTLNARFSGEQQILSLAKTIPATNVFTKVDFLHQVGDILFDLSEPDEPVALEDGIYSITTSVRHDTDVSAADGTSLAIRLTLGPLAISFDYLPFLVKDPQFSSAFRPINATYKLAEGDSFSLQISNNSAIDQDVLANAFVLTKIG